MKRATQNQPVASTEKTLDDTPNPFASFTLEVRYKMFLDCCVGGNLEDLNQLLKFMDVQANVAIDSNLALRLAALNGHLYLVHRLLEFEAVRVDVGALNNRALAIAFCNGHHDVAVTLVNHGADPSCLPEWQQRIITQKISPEFVNLLSNFRIFSIHAPEAQQANGESGSEAKITQHQSKKQKR